MARPTKYTPETADRIVSFITAGANREDAAQACGVCRETLTRWLQSKPEFFTRVMEADSTAAIVAERGVYKKDPKAWLQAKRPKIWGRRDNDVAEDAAAALIKLVDAMTAAASANIQPETS